MSVVFMVDELLDVNASDARHMFWEEMTRLVFAMRESQPDDPNDEKMEDFLRVMDQVSSVLRTIERKREVREREIK